VHLRPGFGPVRPVETDAARFDLQALSAQQGRQVARHAVERGARPPIAPGLVALDSLPLGERLPGIRDDAVAEHVRVSARHLVDQTFEHVRRGELTRLARHLAVEDDLEEQITEFLHEVIRILFVDGVQDLVGFLDQVGFQRGAGLFAIPGASTLAAQPGHQ